MPWRARALVLALTLCVVVSACSIRFGPVARPKSYQRTIKVAVIGTFSGASAAQGENLANSVNVEVDAINARGGLLGRPVEVVTADDEQNPAKASELVRQQLQDPDVAFLVGPSSTSTFQAVKPQVVQAHIPNCVVTVADDALSGADSTFRADGLDRGRVSALLNWVRRARPDVKRFGLVDDGSPWAQADDRLFADQAGRAELTYVGHASAPGAEADPRSAVQQVLNQNVQAVVLVGEPAAAAHAASAVRQLGGGGKLLILGLSDLASYQFATLAGDAAVDSVFSSPIQAYLTGVPNSAWPPAYHAFVRGIAGQYGYAANGVELRGTPAGGDCVLQWAAAVGRAGTLRGEGVARAWESLDLPAAETALGVPERFSAADHGGQTAGSAFVYSWTRQGKDYRLKQLAGPQ